jgi:hypothetical protein
LVTGLILTFLAGMLVRYDSALGLEQGRFVLLGAALGAALGAVPDATPERRAVGGRSASRPLGSAIGSTPRTCRLVSALGLRPAGLPAWCGRDYLLTGYRVFVRFPTPGGRTMRGLYILRSDTNRLAMVLGGNLLTRYGYRLARIRFEAPAPGQLAVSVRSRDGAADLDVLADLDAEPAPLPAGSPFADPADARRFAGPLPYTFDHEPGTGRIVVVKAHRSTWRPHPVRVQVRRLSFLARGPFAEAKPVLAQAFHVADVEYGWYRGVRR